MSYQLSSRAGMSNRELTDTMSVTAAAVQTVKHENGVKDRKEMFQGEQSVAVLQTLESDVRHLRSYSALLKDYWSDVGLETDSALKNLQQDDKSSAVFHNVIELKEVVKGFG